jgi:hypothetical protein
MSGEQALRRLARPGFLQQTLDQRRLCRGQSDTQPYDSLAPEKPFHGLRLKSDCQLALFFLDEYMQMLTLGRNRCEDLAAYPERRVVEVRLFRGRGKRHGDSTSLLELHVAELHVGFISSGAGLKARRRGWTPRYCG